MAVLVLRVVVTTIASFPRLATVWCGRCVIWTWQAAWSEAILWNGQHCPCAACWLRALADKGPLDRDAGSVREEDGLLGLIEVKWMLLEALFC